MEEKKRPLLAHVAREDSADAPPEGRYDEAQQISVSEKDDATPVVNTEEGKHSMATNPGARRAATDGGDIPDN